VVCSVKIRPMMSEIENVRRIPEKMDLTRLKPLKMEG
jgi:hypothetical protein